MSGRIAAQPSIFYSFVFKPVQKNNQNFKLKMSSSAVKYDETSDEQTEIDMGDLKLISACCCTVSGFYCPEFKKCFGGHAKGAMFCMGFETLCCKMQTASEENDQQCCILQEARCVAKKSCTVSVFLG